MWIVQSQLKTNKRQAQEFDRIVNTFQYNWKSSAGKGQVLFLPQLLWSSEQTLVPSYRMVDWTRIFWSYYTPSGYFFWRCNLRAAKDLLENPGYSHTVVYETCKLRGNVFFGDLRFGTFPKSSFSVFFFCFVFATLSNVTQLKCCLQLTWHKIWVNIL